MSELTIDFRTIVAAISWFAAAILLLALVLVLRASYLRRAAIRRERDLERLRAEWATLGRVPRKYALEWMLLWNQAQHAAFPQTPVGHAMRSLALRWAKRGDVVERVAAITMLGHLRESSSAPILHSLCDGPNALISIAAAHALLQIEPRFADRFVTLICARADWAPGKLAAIVREKAELLTAPLLDLCRTAGVPAARAAAPYLRYLDAEKAVPVLRTLLQTVSDPETLAAALKALTAIGSAADASAVSKLTADERWQVRLQAANALGALGAQSHIALLAAMLSDSHWWVRYRAAQAIATLSIRSKADITRVLTERDDPFARDALVQALAERGRIVQGAGGR